MDVVHGVSDDAVTPVSLHNKTSNGVNLVLVSGTML